MSDIVTVQIPDKTLNQMVTDHVRTAFLSALENDKDKVVAKIVDHAIFGKVKVGYSEVPFIDNLIEQVLREECRAILKEWITTNRANLAAQMHKRLTQKKTLCSKLIDSMLESVTDGWRFSFEVKAFNQNG